MPENDNTPAVLVQIKDILGLSEPAKRLSEAIVRGIGEWAYPWQVERKNRADTKALKRATAALKREGLSIETAELSLDERANMRFTAQLRRQQHNREAVAIQAIQEMKATLDRPTATVRHRSTADIPALEAEWLDRFWRLAEDVSREDFQSLWGRVLARQSSGAANYSARCLQTLSTLSSIEAKALERLATFAVTIDRPRIGKECCILFGVRGRSYDGTLRIKEYEAANRLLYDWVGNIRRDIWGPIGIIVEGSAHEIVGTIQEATLRIAIAGRPFRINGYAQQQPDIGVPEEDAVVGGGYQFSPVGLEILGLIDATPAPEFIRLFGAALATLGLTLDDEA
jgi:hypothetical protein